MNNRKQQVVSMLDSLTMKEINDYINERHINKDLKEKFKRLASTKQPSHFETITNSINEKSVLNEVTNKYYYLGEAYVIAFILECFYDKKYKINDLKYYLKELIDGNETVKEYVYEIMKDF